MMKYQLGMVLGMALCVSTAEAQTLDDAAFQKIAGEVFAPIMQEYDIPGIAVGVTIDGQRYVFTSGQASRESGSAVATDTLFELGSVSKLFNVALAALAEQQGKLSLDDMVSAKMPELAGSAFDRISLYDLAANANGGMPLQVPDEITNDSELTEWLVAWNPDGDPQAVRSYSNMSIGLLGQIVGKSYGGSFQDAARDKLLPLLGLNDTYIAVPDQAMPRYAFGYSKANAPVRVNPGMLAAEAYGVKSSVTDMVGFLDAHLGNTDLSPEMQAALARTREARYDTAHFAQAMIWEEYSWPADRAALEAGNNGDMSMSPQPISKRSGPVEGPVLLSKTGSTNGFGAYVALVPDERVGIVVLANRNYPNTVRVEAAMDLVEKVLAVSDE